MTDLDLEYVLERLRLADEGQQPVGNIIIAIGALVEVLFQHQRRIEAVEKQQRRENEMKVSWSSREGEVLADGIEIELAANGDGLNVAGFWIDTAPYNPNDLDEVREIITSNADVQLRLNRARAERDYARACMARAWERTT